MTSRCRFPICVRVEIAGDEVLIDLEGTSPQVEASVNCPVGMVLRGGLLRDPRDRAGRDPELRGLHGADPDQCAAAGTVVNPVLPGGVRCPRRDRLPRLRRDHGALGADRARPRHRCRRGRPDADCLGWLRTAWDDEGRKPFGTTEVLVGSWGARSSLDGLEGVSNPLANLGNQPVELIEADLPLRIERYGVVPDSGGAGRRRGGLAYVREYELLAPHATLTFRTDRRDHPPYGLDGGEPGAPSSNVVVSGDEARELPTMPMSAFALGKATVSPTPRRAAAASGIRSSAIRPPCSTTCSTARSPSQLPATATASS